RLSDVAIQEIRGEGSARLLFNSSPAFFHPGSISAEILEFHRKLPGYKVTPLVAAPLIARRLNVRNIWVKDESDRLGLPAYKVLGAAWAAYCALRRQIGGFGPWAAIGDLADQLRAHRHLELVAA